MSREVHVRFWESAEVRFPRATHLPLYRQEAIYERAGHLIARSTLAQWVGECGAQLQPLVQALADCQHRNTFPPGSVPDGNQLQQAQKLVSAVAVFKLENATADLLGSPAHRPHFHVAPRTVGVNPSHLRNESSVSHRVMPETHPHRLPAVLPIPAIQREPDEWTSF